MFSKFVKEKAFMLECNISYIANWYYGSDYMAITSTVLQKVIVQYLNYGNYISFSWWGQDQIGIKLGTNHVTHLKLARFT